MSFRPTDISYTNHRCIYMFLWVISSSNNQITAGQDLYLEVAWELHRCCSGKARYNWCLVAWFRVPVVFDDFGTPSICRFKIPPFGTDTDLRLNTRTFFAGPVPVARIEKVNRLMDMFLNATRLYIAGFLSTTSWPICVLRSQTQGTASHSCFLGECEERCQHFLDEIWCRESAMGLLLSVVFCTLIEILMHVLEDKTSGISSWPTSYMLKVYPKQT